MEDCGDQDSSEEDGERFRDGMSIVERTAQRSTLGLYGGKESGNGGRRARKSAISDTQPRSTL